MANFSALVICAGGLLGATGIAGAATAAVVGGGGAVATDPALDCGGAKVDGSVTDGLLLLSFAEDVEEELCARKLAKLDFPAAGFACDKDGAAALAFTAET